MVLEPGASTSRAKADVDSLHLGAIDEVVQVGSTSPKANVAVIVTFIVLGVVGLLLLVATLTMRRRARPAAPDTA